VLVYKRLAQGTFVLPTATLPGQTHVDMPASELTLMLEGIDLRDAKRRKRYLQNESMIE